MSEFRPLMWHPSQEPGAKASDGTWGCPDAVQPYPAMHHSLVHPCTSPVGECCGLPQASFNLRFQSFLAAPKGMLLMAYEVQLSPICISMLIRFRYCAAPSKVAYIPRSMHHVWLRDEQLASQRLLWGNAGLHAGWRCLCKHQGSRGREACSPSVAEVCIVIA